MSNYQPFPGQPTSPGPGGDPSWASRAGDPPPPADMPYAFAPPAYQRTSGPQGAVPNRMGLAVAATLLFFPLGLYAIYLASQVSGKVLVGDLVGAVAESHKVKTISMIAFAIGGVLWLFFLMSACCALMMSAAYA